MKKPLKKILYGFLILFSALFLFFLVMYIKMKLAMKDIKPTETKELVDHVYSVKDGYVSMFIVGDGSAYIAVDAGSDSEHIGGELKKLSIDPDKVVAVLLTHTDSDHTGALKLFKNARVYLSKEEEKMLNGQAKKPLMGGNTLAVKDYLLVNDGDTLNFNGIQVKGYLTPGHTSGSMCWLVNGTYLFVGDACNLKNGKIDKPVDFFTMDTKLARKSMDIITHIPGAGYIFTAHTGYTDDYKYAVEDWNSSK
jgi:hydroxyacylglutathione hydrolase